MMVLIPAILAATGLLLVLVSILFSIKRKSKKSLPEEVNLSFCLMKGQYLVLIPIGSKSILLNDSVQNAGVEQQPARGNRNRIQAGLRRRRGRGTANEDDHAGGDGNGEGHGDGDGAADDNAVANVKAVRRKDAYEARRAAKDMEREAQEAAQEEEIRRAAELRAQREAEEAEKWMQTFTVEATGEDAVSKEEGEALLTKMVEYLKARKTVALEELAAEFGMRTGDVVTKVQGLEEGGLITGIMDDRGKYIYISREEMERVADFIRSTGRIAISELAAKSASLIDLEGKMMPSNELEASQDLQELLFD